MCTAVSSKNILQVFLLQVEIILALEFLSALNQAAQKIKKILLFIIQI